MVKRIVEELYLVEAKNKDSIELKEKNRIDFNENQKVSCALPSDFTPIYLTRLNNLQLVLKKIGAETKKRKNDKDREIKLQLTNKSGNYLHISSINSFFKCLYSNNELMGRYIYVSSISRQNVPQQRIYFYIHTSDEIPEQDYYDLDNGVELIKK